MIRLIITTIGSLLLVSSFFLGCVSVKGHLKYANRPTTELPDDAFAFVEVKQSASAGECLKSERFEECNQMIKQLPPIVKKGSGSGMLVWAKHKPVFLTAAHVCLDDMPNEFDQDGIKFTIVKKNQIRVLDSTGTYMNTKIIAVDEKTDLCALDVPKMKAPPVKISHRAPKVGDKVFAISAPYGIHEPTMTLIFNGYYSGYGDKWHFYTIPTRPGSSGSAVLNENHRVIGMLNAAFLSIEHVGLGAGHQDIVDFIEKIAAEDQE